MRKKTKSRTRPMRDESAAPVRFSSEVGSLGCLSPEDERDLASLVNPAIHPEYNKSSAWWTVALLVTTLRGRSTYEGKGRTYIQALSSALAHWRVDRRKKAAQEKKAS